MRTQTSPYPENQSFISSLATERSDRPEHRLVWSACGWLCRTMRVGIKWTFRSGLLPHHRHWRHAMQTLWLIHYYSFSHALFLRAVYRSLTCTTRCASLSTPHTAVGLLRLLVRLSGTQLDDSGRVMFTASNSSLKQSCSAFTSATSALEVNFYVMCSINLRFTLFYNLLYTGWYLYRRYRGTTTERPFTPFLRGRNNTKQLKVDE